MGILIGLSGLVVAIYAVYNGLGLWMAQHVAAMERGEEPITDDDGLSLYDHMPKTHLEMMKYYSQGVKGLLWRGSFLCLIAAVIGLMFESQYAVYLYGVALAIDCLIFITYDKKQEFLANTTEAERLFDASQYMVLLGAFLILSWRHIQ